jgi:hypothetical protein
MRVLLTARHGAIIARTRAIGQLKALIVNAPEGLRQQLRRGTSDQQLDRCARLRTLPSQSVERRATVQAVRAVARRALGLETETAEPAPPYRKATTGSRSSPAATQRPAGTHRQPRPYPPDLTW